MRTRIAVGFIVGLAAIAALSSTVSGQQRVQIKETTQDNAAEIFDLAWKYDQGNGVPLNRARAMALYREAADLGHADAMLRLGNAYDNFGGPVPQDHAEAARWYRKACELGQGSAMYMLGVLYWTGRGVSQDYVEAYKWLDLAATHATDQHQHGATTSRTGIARVMTPVMIAEGQKRARDWQTAFDQRKR